MTAGNETDVESEKPEPLALSYPQLLAEIGRFLYGEVSWQRQLAENLQHPHLPYRGIDPSALKKWISEGKERRGVPWWVAEDLLRLVKEVRLARIDREDAVLKGLLEEIQGEKAR